MPRSAFARWHGPRRPANRPREMGRRDESASTGRLAGPTTGMTKALPALRRRRDRLPIQSSFRVPSEPTAEADARFYQQPRRRFAVRGARRIPLTRRVAPGLSAWDRRDAMWLE